MQQARLPESVKEIADVIGRERALYLVGALPTYTAGASGKKSSRVILYVPTLSRLSDDHDLVRILGRADAVKMVEHFGGENLYPANCAEIYRRYRTKTMARMVGEGQSVSCVAKTFDVSGRTVRNACAG